MQKQSQSLYPKDSGSISRAIKMSSSAILTALEFYYSSPSDRIKDSVSRVPARLNFFSNPWHRPKAHRQPINIQSIGALEEDL